MGKAIIKSSQGEGRYIVDIEMDTRRADARKQVLNEANEKLITEQIPSATQKTDEEYYKLNEKWTALNDYLRSISGDVGFDTISKLTTAALEQKFEYDLALRRENTLRARLLANQKELELLNREVKKLIQRPAWCIEYNENLSGAVATVEADYLIKMRGIDGEPEKDPILLPVPHGGSHGMLQPIHSSGPASTFFNLAVYPGAQKHKPRYRLGTITALNKDNDTASVSLDVATRDPDQNSLTYVQDFKPFSFNNVLNNISVQYMTCNAKAFDVGDRVVVGFGGVWENGKVIGFEANPRRCEEPEELWTIVADLRCFQGYSQDYSEGWDNLSFRPPHIDGFAKPNFTEVPAASGVMSITASKLGGLIMIDSHTGGLSSVSGDVVTASRISGFPKTINGKLYNWYFRLKITHSSNGSTTGTPNPFEKYNAFSYLREHELSGTTDMRVDLIHTINGAIVQELPAYHSIATLSTSYSSDFITGGPNDPVFDNITTINVTVEEHKYKWQNSTHSDPTEHVIINGNYTRSGPLGMQGSITSSYHVTGDRSGGGSTALELTWLSMHPSLTIYGWPREEGDWSALYTVSSKDRLSVS